VDDRAPWEKLLREALTILALPADEQVRVNGPGCVTCDLLEDFDHARRVATGNEAELSDDQRRSLEAINAVMRSMEKPDFECFNNEVLRRPVWEGLRKLAADALRLFGWEGTVVEPFVEVEPGVWRRAPSTAQTDTTHERGV
jgi:hypothetical protein